MKALSGIAVVFAAFLIFLGLISRKTSGGLSNAIAVAGGIIIVFVSVVWIITFLKEKREK
jgi:hypothetical protein